MAHQFLKLERFAELLMIEMLSPSEWPKNIRNIIEYNQALGEDCHEYFFMRGVEGYLSNRSDHPFYHGHGWAQSAWMEGRNFANYYFKNIQNILWHQYQSNAWISAFMTCDYMIVQNDGLYEEDPESWYAKVFGVYARLVANAKYRNAGVGCFLYDRMVPPKDRAHLRIPYQKQFKLTQGNSKMAQLYKDVATGAIGTWIGEDAEGVVLKTDDGFKVFKEVRKVMPYTVRVKFTGGASSHIKLEKGKYLVGDVLLTYVSNKGPQMMSIRELDTEKEDACDAPQVIKFIHKMTRPKAKK
ncbi:MULTISPECIES: hypothetical protein [Pseudomonadota]|uniref:hypothetical protein n=1 Tax=Pseudomonadota TaxID=1224 RepID=UPI0026086B4E|nr:MULTISPECIES: hypothetical protein [Pseudomonadota]